MLDLSIIIPTCKNRISLFRALDSILNQHINYDYEIVIVDDSIDSSLNEGSELLRYLAKFKVIRYLKNTKNRGAGAARNYGVMHANGRYITFLDDDDWYMPGRINSMLNFIVKGKYNVVSSGRIFEVGDLKELILDERQQFGEFTLSDIKYGNDIDIGFMVERKLFNENNGFDERLQSLEDWDFLLRVMRNGVGYKIRRLDYVVNISTNTPRVSDSRSKGYAAIAEKYKSTFGKAWYGFMLAISDRESLKINLIDICRNSITNMTLIPVKVYLIFFIKKAIKILHK